MAMTAAWSVVCDFDGTVTPIDVTDEVLARFARPGWQALEAKWRAGAIGSRTCMAGQVELLDCDAASLERFLATVEVDPHFAAFVAAVRLRGWPCEIVSDGLDQVCRSILRRHGMDELPLAANRLVQVGERRWRLDFPHSKPGCTAGNCKCARAASLAPTGRRLLLIGDGASDFCVARKANAVFARGALLAHCAAAGVPHERVVDFRQAIASLARLDAMARLSTEDIAP